MEYTIDSILHWADKRNLINGSDPKSQCLKLMSEVGELADNINKKQDCRDDIGDCLVVLTILSKQLGYSLSECMEIAYNDIKDRKGIMVDGVFIKESDPAYLMAKD